MGQLGELSTVYYDKVVTAALQEPFTNCDSTRKAEAVYWGWVRQVQLSGDPVPPERQLEGREGVGDSEAKCMEDQSELCALTPASDLEPLNWLLSGQRGALLRGDQETADKIQAQADECQAFKCQDAAFASGDGHDCAQSPTDCQDGLMCTNTPSDTSLLTCAYEGTTSVTQAHVGKAHASVRFKETGIDGCALDYAVESGTLTIDTLGDNCLAVPNEVTIDPQNTIGGLVLTPGAGSSVVGNFVTSWTGTINCPQGPPQQATEKIQWLYALGEPLPEVGGSITGSSSLAAASNHLGLGSQAGCTLVG